ncbi:Xaa-Pro aminopeptidase [Chitinivorax tropicus]|uniref:Xaa-Pro aminopeptidase n=1 Tax=Chitinivorax tropicus TaxID=714531 RepID=A0A840MHP8_9PROT|nr:aminopeptidase P family protein [Chitinivorax tropicus]MBB5017920.1 Xaa-Pro aminopeptidase [Chitinivorax tropicus]
MDTAMPTATHIRDRITKLRHAMQQHQLDAYLVPSSDPHISEYLPERWQGRQWLSGFTGSVATLIVTQSFAGLWVDSRYWVQAEAELVGTGIGLMKIQSAAASNHVDWLAANVPASGCVGVDGAVLGLAAARTLEQALTAKGARLNSQIDLLDSIWPGRPSLPATPIYEHLPPYATVSRTERLATIRQAMQEKGAQWHFISTLDDIGWLLNLRGADVSYNPVFVAHALIGPDDVSLFVAAGKVSAELASTLARDGVLVKPYDEAPSALAALPAGTTILIDPRRVTLGLLQAVPSTTTVIEAVNPSTFAKSRKSAAEAAHVRQAMELDGAALCEFFSWLEQALGNERITEVTIDEQITAARARRPGFVCPSFGTIAGFNANGAMPHYRATEASHAVIEGSGLLLIDSGGQYLNGTTDITRVVAIGEPSAEQKRDFTLVLKGTLALSQVQFPRGLKSPMLDAIARAPIWAAGINYGHGTGHGVGYFMNVHEGPQVISCYGMPEPHTAMEPGMITSIEPGIYRPGKWGARIENLVLNVDGDQGEFGEYLRFETLTLCPIDTRCLDLSILRDDELAWLNDYHAEVRRRLSPLVSGDALSWLQRSTEPVIR